RSELDDLPRLQVPDELEPEGIEDDAFGRNHEPAVPLADAQRTDRQGVADRIDRVVDHEREAVRPDEPRGEFFQGPLDVSAEVHDLVREQSNDDLAIGRRHEGPALLAQLLPDLVRVRYVAVVREGDVSVRG